MRPQLRRWLQLRWERLEREARDVGEIRAGDPLAARFASFGARSRIAAPRVSLVNPASVAIGEDVYLRSYLAIEALAPPGTVVLRFGNRVQVGHFCRFVAINGIDVEDDAGIGHNVTIADTVHDKSVDSVAPGWKTPLKLGRGLRIETGALIGNNNVITGGLTIGARSITAPNTVITKNVPPDVIVGGNPAQVLRRKRPDGEWEWLVDPSGLDLETQAAAGRRDAPPTT